MNSPISSGAGNGDQRPPKYTSRNVCIPTRPSFWSVHSQSTVLPCQRLCAADMVLHAAPHMSQSGDLHQGLHELMDVDGLIRFFSTRPAFWQELLERAPRRTCIARSFMLSVLSLVSGNSDSRISHVGQPSAATAPSDPSRDGPTRFPSLATEACQHGDPGNKSAQWLLNVRSQSGLACRLYY